VRNRINIRKTGLIVLIGAAVITGVSGCKKKEPDNAIADHKKAIEINPKNAEAYICRGFAFMAVKKMDKAIADWTEAIQLAPNPAESYFYRGTAYSIIGESEKAREDFLKAKGLGFKIDQQLLRNPQEASGPQK
jgi:Tfp pilus assembly protein PilF